jgi:hypothetical protein
MRPNSSTASLIKSGLAASVLLLTAGVAYAQSVTLTAAPTNTVLPDGQTVPMWGYTCGVGTAAPTGGAACAAANPAAGTNWSPVVITVPYTESSPGVSNTSLSITLNNSLTFPTTGAPNNIPTSLVIVGQLGGGLGGAPTRTTSPTHAPAGPTWPAAGGASIDCSNPADAGANGTFCPPGQPDRVQSFATEVPGGCSSGATCGSGAVPALTWTGLRPGTYLIHSGTHPSIQVPMGLYGVLIVTTPAVTTTTPVTPALAYAGLSYDADVPLVLGEIDPLQNGAVAAAVATVGFSETRVWSGQPGQCGDPAAASAFNTCYPPAVNYSPRYYLINGVSFDRTNLGASTLAPALPTTPATGNLLLRFVNAGLRMHVPSVVGRNLTLWAEDGNLLPGTQKAQSEVFLAAGKTYDVTIKPAVATVGGAYAQATYPLFDRQLSLSTNNQRDGGMQAYIAVAGGTPAAGTVLSATGKTFYCVAGTPLVVADPSKGLLGGTSGANGVVLGAISSGAIVPPVFGGSVASSNLTVESNGTFSYTPPAGSCAGSFSYVVNGTTQLTATITQCDATSSVPACGAIGPPTAVADNYTSSVASRLHVGSPGVLANDTDPKGLPLTAAIVGSATGGTVTLNADGSFTAQPTTPPACTATLPPVCTPATVTFSYNAVNSQKSTSSSSALVTVTFGAASGVKVSLVDAIDPRIAITDYRWVIEEDKTFYVDPACQVNSTDPTLRPSTCPPLPVQSLGYNFHTASMPVVATGCVGFVSCEGGQTQLGQAVACDVGNGDCRAAAQKDALDPSLVALDPTKRYFISILPGDGINPSVAATGGPVDDAAFPGGTRPFRTTGGTNNLGDCTSFATPANAAGAYGDCGHNMGGAPIAAGQTAVTMRLQRTPLPTAQISVFVFADDNPLNGENDAGGATGANGPAPNEAGLEAFNIVLFDQAGGLGDNTGQPTYDMFNQPLSNSLAGTIDPLTGRNACPVIARADGIVGMITVCPKFEDDGVTLSPLVGQAVISNLYPGLYEVAAAPGADRIARGEEWLQTNTLDGGKPHEAFIKPSEPSYFQEFGPGGFHVSMGFANPQIINDRRSNSAGTGICDLPPNGGGMSCTATLYGQVQNTRMSRTPDQRMYPSGDYTADGFTQCYVAIGSPDEADFAFAKCDANGNFVLANIPTGDFKLTVFDQWNDLMLDGLVNPVHVGTSGKGASSGDPVVFPVTQWRTNLYTRSFLDVGTGAPGSAGYRDGVSNVDGDGNPTEPGLALVSTNIRYRDGSFGFFNNTDLNGFAGFNEVFPFMNWLVVETSSTRYKPTGTHVVYDTGGPADGTAGGGSSTIGAGLANTLESNSVPAALRVPGAVYCTGADCVGSSIGLGPYYTNNPGAPTGPLTGLSSGRIDPPQPFGNTEAWQGLLGQATFMEFGMKPFLPGENGGINGHVIYASTRPFDDPTLLLQLSWEPGVPRVTINLYQESTAADGEKSLKLVDTTKTTSWDDWAQGFRHDASGNLVSMTDTSGVACTAPNTPAGCNPNYGNPAYVPNMNCPGQPPDSPFFQTLQGSTQWLDDPSTQHPLVPGKLPLASQSQFKCYDGWSQLNQAQPAPYDGMYKFPSVVAINPATGRPAGTGTAVGTPGSQPGTNCTICVANPDDGTPMLPSAGMVLPDGTTATGKYVVEVIVPPGFDLVKEEDKNILVGDIYIAPVTQQFAGFGNVYIMPDQAAVGATYNKNNALNMTTDLGASPYHEGDTGSVEAFWPCVGAQRVVPDYNSLFPGVQQNAPFAGATRPLCDRKEVILKDQMSVLAKFYVFTPAHIAGHFTGTITNDFASEFDPFSPQFGEKFGPPNLPVSMRDFGGNEVARVYSDQWGIYNGLYFSSWEVNPPNPTGYAPQMSIACMNDPGPIVDTRPLCAANGSNAGYCTTTPGATITDPAYNAAYSNFCYEMPFMPGFTAYMDTPVIPTQGFADGYNLPDSEYPDATPAIASVIGGSGVAGPWVSAAGQTLTITALGDKVVQNPAFSGPGATGAPYNQKTVKRHYGFGSRPGTCPASGNCPNATVAGVPMTNVSTWNDTTIVGQVPTISATLSATTGVGSTCYNGTSNTIPAGQTPPQRGANGAVLTTGLTAYRCGELVITAGNGKQSIDAVTVTVAGKPPTAIINGENVAGNAIQTAVNNAAPGDLIIVGAGSYKEHVLMWKPVRLQGVGAASVTINADAHPSGVLDPWRRQVTCLFGLAINGVPWNTFGSTNTQYDPTGQYSCPTSMYMRSDRIPFEAIVGWDASGNGNLAQILQEPTLMGAYEGAGITVLGRGVRIPAASNDLWGIQAAAGGGVAGQYPDGSVYLTNSTTDCRVTGGADGKDYGTGNFLCNPSRIDGLSITNSSQGGGGIFLHGWNHFLEIANTRIFGNHGTLTGGINLGNGEAPTLYVNDGTLCGNAVPAPRPLCPPFAGVLPNAAIPFQMYTRVRVHHNDIYNNASLGDALFSGTPSGAGGITISAGADSYRIDHNWIAGNLSTSDGGGISHLGLSFNGKIDHNYVLFNQSTNPTLPTNGGGIGIIGANNPRTYASGPLVGQECGTATDTDCPPGLGDGTGANLLIDANLIIGNSAESGSGGGVRLQQVNGTELTTFPYNLAPTTWYGVTLQNNIIANNVAGWDGAGVSLEDALRVTIVNNTIVSNDTTASAGVLFKTLGAINASSPPPGCSPTTDLASAPQDPNCLSPNAAHIPQPAGLVTEKNTPNLVDAMNGLQALVGVRWICPAGYNGGLLNSVINGNCAILSLPQLTNDIFWQNRAFHVEITGSGAGLQSQQNLISLLPMLNQAATGDCAAGANYWDVGVRDDSSPTNHGGGGTLTLTSSILTSTAGGYANNGNLAPAGSPVNAQYCNGSRVPPENGGHGYLSPPGRSETTGLSNLFVFNNITPAATVDEGNNWINLTYGPLTLFNTATQSMLTAASTGTVAGAYSIGSASAAVNAGTNTGAPAQDFFGNTRALTAANRADIGAVEFQAANVSGQAVVAVAPSPLAFGAIGLTRVVTRDLTLTNNGGASFTGFTIGVTGTGFARVTTGVAGNCVAPLAAGTSCTIRVQFTPQSPSGTASSGSVAITGGNVAVTNAPVTLSGSSVAATSLATVGPSTLNFGTWYSGAGATASPTLNVSVINTGTLPLAGLAGPVPAPFSRVTGGTFPVGAPNCGATLDVGAVCTIKVQFLPTTTGAVTRTLTVTATGATITPPTVTLNGSGVATRATASVAPNPLHITLPTGVNTGSEVVTLTNTAAAGGASIAVTGAAATGGNQLTWFFSTVNGADTCTGNVLAPGASCGVRVSFTNVTSTRGTNRAGTATFTTNGLAANPSGALIGRATP